jgi:hypothetical protein
LADNTPRRAIYGQTYQGANQLQQIMRRAGRYYGEGDYYEGDGDYRQPLKYLSRGVGALAGGGLGYMQGGLAGAVTGAREGWGRGAGFSQFMGWGDYGPVSTNQLIGGGGSQQQISVNAGNNQGDVIMSNTEFIGNIYATVPAGGTISPFEIRKYELNIGIEDVFPFTSQLAQNYVLYAFQGLMFQFKPTSGEFGSSTSNSLGKIVMATQYDPEAPDFRNTIQMENYAYANSTKPSCGAIHGVETAPGTRSADAMYIRSGQSTKSLIFTDYGNFYLASEGIPINNTGSLLPQRAIIGELWVTYSVILSRPQLYGNKLGKNIHTDLFRSTTSALTAIFTLQTHSQNTIGGSLTVDAAAPERLLTYTWPDTIDLGYYTVTVWVDKATAFPTDTGFSNTPTVLTNCLMARPFAAFSGTSTMHLMPNANNNSTNNLRIGFHTVIKIEAPGFQIASFTFGLLPTKNFGTDSQIYVTVTEANSNSYEIIA